MINFDEEERGKVCKIHRDSVALLRDSKDLDQILGGVRVETCILCKLLITKLILVITYKPRGGLEQDGFGLIHLQGLTTGVDHAFLCVTTGTSLSNFVKRKSIFFAVVMQMAEGKIIIKESAGKGFGMFACAPIKKGEIIYPICTRLYMSQEVCQGIIKQNKKCAIKTLLSWGWATKDKYCLPLGVEGFVNHSIENANSRNRVALRDIEVGEEILEDYGVYDKKYPWYVELAKIFKVWTH